MARILTVLPVMSSGPAMFIPPSTATFAAPLGWGYWGHAHPVPLLRRPAGSSQQKTPMAGKTLTIRADGGGVAKITGKKKIAGTRWLELQQLEYQDESGVPRIWDAVSRPGGPDLCAVAVLPILKQTSMPDRVMLITQFRPAVGRYCIEAPAGLIERGADMRDTAARELLEETGLTCSRFLADDAGVLLNDPGITPTSVKLFVAVVDMDSPENVKANEIGHDGVYGLASEGEYIRRKIVPLANLRESLMQFEKDGYAVDGKLMCFARGIQFGMDMANGKLG